jgi:hypothetical protein
MADDRASTGTILKYSIIWQVGIVCFFSLKFSVFCVASDTYKLDF